MGVDQAFLPCDITKNGNYCKKEILKTGKGKTFIKIKRNRDKITNDPVYPVFQFFPGHEPHAHKENTRGKCVQVCGPIQPPVKIIIDQVNKQAGTYKEQGSINMFLTCHSCNWS